MGACGVLHGAVFSVGHLFRRLSLGMEGYHTCSFAGAVSYLLVCHRLCGRVPALALFGTTGAELIQEGVSVIPGTSDGNVFSLFFS